MAISENVRQLELHTPYKIVCLCHCCECFQLCTHLC